MFQTVLGLRLVLTYGLILLVAFTLSFGAVTILGRRQWVSLGVIESMAARLAAAVVLALLVLGGVSNVAWTSIALFNNFTAVPFTDPGAMAVARLQTGIGLLVAVGLTALAVTRLEMYHRESTGLSPRGEGAEWVDDTGSHRRTP